MLFSFLRLLPFPLAFLSPSHTSFFYFFPSLFCYSGINRSPLMVIHRRSRFPSRLYSGRCHLSLSSYPSLLPLFFSFTSHPVLHEETRPRTNIDRISTLIRSFCPSVVSLP